MPSRRDETARATSTEIVRVARDAFAAQGYAAVKLVDLARSANVTTGAIYHHFGGKEGLLLAVGEQVEREVVTAIGARVPADATAWQAIEAAAVATLALCARPEVAAIIFRECPNVLGAAAWRAVEMHYGLGALQTLFDRAAAEGALRPADPALVTRLFMAALIEAVEAIVDDPARTVAAHAALERLIEAFRAER